MAKEYKPLDEPDPRWRRKPELSEVPPAPPPPENWYAPEHSAEELAKQGKEALISSYNVDQLRRLTVELAKRKVEGLKLYEPLPEQERFHASRVRQRLLRGSNRGGKTLPAAIEVARAVTGQDPHNKFPRYNGRCFCVGKNLDHVGQVMWRKLGRAGAFKIIRDLGTGQWRAYRPWDKSDLDRGDQSKPAPPLIPPRLIKSIAWENKAKGTPKLVTLLNGWELSFFSSEGKPPQGSDIDLWWFDEEIVDEEWHPEMVARILDRKGQGIWSATPQAATEKLYELHEKAAQQAKFETPAVAEFVILLRDNPHIGMQEKKEFAESLSDEEQRVRVDGEFKIGYYRVYPEFSLRIHGEPIVSQHRKGIPPDWTRYAVVDPGHQVCAVLFAAVPPAPNDEELWLYDELYIRNADSAMFGERMAQACAEQQFHAFLIDGHAGRQTQIASGHTIEEQYSEALKANRVKSIRTGHGFLWGSDDIQAGVNAVHRYLRISEGGKPRLRVLLQNQEDTPEVTLVSKLQNFHEEIKRYHNKREKDRPSDKPDQRGDVHLCDCLRYLCMFAPKWHAPQHVKREATGALKVLREKQKRKREREGGKGISLGPIGATRA